ncbi:MAG: TolC family protein [Sulfurimonas sp.]|nr:TolC family protein [Sulfurimonas sp.]
MKLFSIFLFSAASLYALTLDEALERAMDNSPLIHKAKSNVEYAKTGELEAESRLHPTLDVGFNWQDSDETTAFSFSPSHYYNLSTKYNLFNGFSDKANIDSKELQTQAQKLLLMARQSDVKLEVIQAYIASLKAIKSIQTQEDELHSLERSYSDAKIRYEQGMIAKNELLLIDVQKLRSEQSLNIAKSNIKKSRSMLWRVLGGALENEEQIEDIKVDILPVEEFQLLLHTTFEKRAELHALYKQRDALHSEQEVVAGAFYPQIDLSADYILNDKERYAGTTLVQVKDQVQTKINARWNLYNGRADEAKRLGAAEKIIAQNTDIAAMKLDLEYQLHEAYESYYVAKSQIDVSKKMLESALENYRITNDRYEYGQIDALNLLSAQSDLTAARNDFNNASYDLFVSLATIKRISGEY